MTRRTRRTLPWFGVIALLLVPVLPVHADETEPDPFVQEEMEPGSERPPETAVLEEEEAEAQKEAAEEAKTEPSHNIEKFIDLVLVRPLYVARFVVGLPFFVFYPLTLGSSYDQDVVALLWTEPFEDTFGRPLGEPSEEY